MCKGDGDFEQRIMPADPNLLKTWFGNLHIFWIEAVGFCKNWGVATGVDVMLYPMGRCRFTSPVRRIGGNFCNKVLTSAGTESNWFSLELKLDDFTSGFRTSRVDMAGGCEGVVAAGSWIGTGTGGKLNKYG